MSHHSTKTNNEIMHVLRNPNTSHTPPSPFPRRTTSKIANRKVIQDTPATATSSMVRSSFQDFSFADEDLSMTHFEKADSEFFAEFTYGNKNKQTGNAIAKQEPVVVKQPSHEKNTLALDDYRSRDINEINDIVNASNINHPNASRYHEDVVNSSISLESEVSSYMEECNTVVKNVNRSPQSIIEFDKTAYTSSKPRRAKKKTLINNLNISSFSNASDSCVIRDVSNDDTTSSFVSSKVSYRFENKKRNRGGKIIDESFSKQSTTAEYLDDSDPLARLYEFISGNGLCCAIDDHTDVGEACTEYDWKSSKSKNTNYENKKYYSKKDDTTYDDSTYDDTICDKGTDEMSSYNQRAGSTASYDSSTYYTTDDDETVSRSSMRSKSSYNYRLVNVSSYKSTTESPKLRTTPVGGRRSGRGRYLTSCKRHNSDRCSSRGTSFASSFNSDEPHVHKTELNFCDSKDQSVISLESVPSVAAESVLSHDQASWIEMTTTPMNSPNRNGIETSSSSQLTSPGKTCMSSNQSNFLQNLQTKVVLARNSPVAAKQITRDMKSLSMQQTSSNVDGYFKKLLSVGIQLQINDPPTSKSTHCEKRQGKLLLCFNGHEGGKFEDPFFIWKDMTNKACSFTSPDAANNLKSILLSDIKAIRKPREAELDSYPLITPEHCFLVVLENGTMLFFEAVSVIQMNRVTCGLNGILNKLGNDMNATGDYSWINQSLESIKRKASYIQPCVVEKVARPEKSLMQEATERRKLKRRQNL